MFKCGQLTYYITVIINNYVPTWMSKSWSTYLLLWYTYIRSPSWPVWSPNLLPPPATPPPSPPHQQHPQQPPTTPLWSSPRSRFWSLRQSKHQQLSPQVCTHQDAFRTPDNKHGGGFRFPPWSGPSPRTNSSPGLLPLTPDSPNR